MLIVCIDFSHLGIRNINRQIINRVQKHLKPHLHLLIRQRIRMQTRQQPTHELPFPRPGIQPQTNRAFHHLGMILAAFHLVNAPHHLVSIGRIKVFTNRVGHANLEFGEGEHGSVHGLVGGGVVRAGTGARMAQLVRRLAGRQNVRGRIGIILGNVQRIILIKGFDRHVVRAIHGIVPFALASPALFFAAGAVVAVVGWVGLFAGDVAAGGSLFDFSGGVFVGWFAVLVVADAGLVFAVYWFLGGGEGGDSLTAGIVDLALCIINVNMR